MSTTDIGYAPWGLGKSAGVTSVGAGIATPFGLLLPPGSKVAAYVNSNGTTDGDNAIVRANTVTSINAALQRCRSGKGDIVMVHPDHTESIDAADKWSNLVAGTRIIGMGIGRKRPTITWTATAGQIAVDVADVSIENMNLNFVGINAVAKAINVTAAGFSLIGCKCTIGDTSKVLAIGIEIGAGANDCTITDCTFTGLIASKVTGATIKNPSSTVVDNLVITNCRFFGTTTTLQGHIWIGSACTNMYLADLDLANMDAAAGGEHCIMLENVAMSGHFARIYTIVCDTDTSAAAGKGIGVSGSNVNVRFSECYVCDEARQNSILSPAVCT